MKRNREYLDPLFLSKLANMDLVAKCVVEGFFSGLHPSPFHGFSVEYSDHREYYPGDELKFLDWKMFGRSDKLYIKQFKQETNTTVYILLDSSKSMSFAGDKVSKLDYASFLVAALSYLMLGQCDSVSLMFFAESILKQIPPKSRRTHLNTLLTALQRNKSAGRTDLASILHAVAETTKRKGLVILVSDLLDDESDIYTGLAHLKYLKHDVIVFHILDHQEVNLDYKGLIQFEDLESREKIRTFPQPLQKAYQQQVADFLDDLKRSAGLAGIDYCFIDTSEPLDKALIAYFAKRKRMI